MRSISHRRNHRGKIPRSCGTRRSLSFQHLETRNLLSVDGLLTGDAAYLTLSFAPDKTDVAGHESSLFSTLSHLGAEQVWQNAIVDAFQTWSMHTNGDVGVVGDSGDPFGASGQRRLDSRFGDVRIGAAPLSNDVAAISIPNDAIVSGTWAGDVIFNTEFDFSNVDQLFSIALHEAGHVFGLEHSEDPMSPMHVHGASPNVALTTDDVAQLQENFGVRFADSNELNRHNDEIDRATKLQKVSLDDNVDGSAPSITFGDLNTNDVDVYELDVPDDYSGLATVILRTRELSALSGRISVVDRDGNTLGQATSGIEPSDVEISVQLESDEKYFVQVDSTDAAPRAVGGYALIVKYDNIFAASLDDIDTLTGPRYRFATSTELRRYFQNGENPLWRDDRHTDDDFASATKLETALGYARNSRYELFGTITNSHDADYYTLQTPDADATMVIAISSLNVEGLIPQVVIHDDKMNSVSASTLLNGDGQLVVQVDSLPNKDYTLSITAADSSGSFGIGSYKATISFTASPFKLSTLIDDVRLSSESPQALNEFYVAQPQIFHFLLDVTSEASSGEFVRIQLTNDQQQTFVDLASVVNRQTSPSGVLLQPGKYTIDAQLGSVDGELEPQSDVQFSLFGESASGPFGVSPIDPLDEPIYRCGDIDDVFCFPGGTTTTIPFYLNPTPLFPVFPISTSPLSPELIGAYWWQRTIATNAGNSPPTAVADQYLVQADSQLVVDTTFGLLSNDSDDDGDSIYVVGESAPANGQLALNQDGSFLYTPSQGFTGVDTFSYRSTDGESVSSSSTVTIFVEPILLFGDVNHDGLFNSTDLIR
ncbi:MAG: cadherin-like domain-containing protein, partial [Planctomycetales bacterium]|nr:cadherin-like domain-containing protein [Planctomycetales bacterium]